MTISSTGFTPWAGPTTAIRAAQPKPHFGTVTKDDFFEGAVLINHNRNNEVIYLGQPDSPNWTEPNQVKGTWYINQTWNYGRDPQHPNAFVNSFGLTSSSKNGTYTNDSYTRRQ